jgi:DNA-binding MarR family transcriptional regulator
MSEALSGEEKAVLDNFISAIEAFRLADPEMPVQTVLTLLHTARNEGRSMTELSRVLDMPISSMSRNLSALSDLNRYKKPGLGLIEYGYDAIVDARRKAARLSPKGRLFLKNVMRHLLR